MSARDQLSDYLLGELPADEARRFEAALAEDPALRAEVERLRPVVGRLEALEPAAWEADEALPALRRRWPADPAPEPARRPFWRRPLVLRPGLAAGFAVVLLALGVGVGLLLGDRDDGGGRRRPRGRARAGGAARRLGERDGDVRAAATARPRCA